VGELEKSPIKFSLTKGMKAMRLMVETYSVAIASGILQG
jgi:hypothetical protein